MKFAILILTLFNITCANHTETVKPIKVEVVIYKGLVLQEHPDKSSNIIDSIPWNAEVEIIGSSPKVEIVDGINLKWNKIKYKDKVGWVLGDFFIPVLPYERIELQKEKNVNDYKGKVYSTFNESINYLGGQMMGTHLNYNFRYSKIFVDHIHYLLFEEGVARVGNVSKWKVLDVFKIPTNIKTSSFNMTDRCENENHSNGEIFAIVSKVNEKCEFESIEKVWFFDFTDKKIKEISQEKTSCRPPECCGAGCD